MDKLREKEKKKLKLFLEEGKKMNSDSMLSIFDVNLKLYGCLCMPVQFKFFRHKPVRCVSMCGAKYLALHLQSAKHNQSSWQSFFVLCFCLWLSLSQHVNKQGCVLEEMIGKA